MDVRSGGLLPPGDCLRLRAQRELFQVAARARAPATACLARAAGKPPVMHPDLDREPSLFRRLRELPEEAAQPYGWREFQRRALARTRPAPPLVGGRAPATPSRAPPGLLA